MADILSKQARSALMAKVRSGDTKPEWVLRCALHSLGFRYRLNNKHLPGRPDLVFPKYGAVVFVHGCYWHRHHGCKDASMPKSNVSFWEQKFSENVERDRLVVRTLSERGWHVLVVWECQLLNHTVEAVEEVARALREQLGAAAQVNYGESIAGREKLLAVAEKKVRYRIRKYNHDKD